MKLRHQHILGFAHTVAKLLHETTDLHCAEALPRIQERVAAVIEADMTAERLLEDEADKLLQKQLRTLGNRSDIDQERARQLIKKELAKKKGFIL